MLRALYKFAKIPKLVAGKPPIIINTTSDSDMYRELSPFILPAPPAKNLENLWQFSKVYPDQVYPNGEPTSEWKAWREKGWNSTKAYRYPKGKGAIPLYSYWQEEHLGYIQARKRIYTPEYARNVITTDSYKRLTQIHLDCFKNNQELILLDYDAYDHVALGMSLVDVINNPKRKMGHAFVLMMMLTGLTEECCR